MSILKQTAPTASSLLRSDAELFAAAVDAYGMLSSVLFKNEAPDTIPADAFTAEQLAETIKAYSALISHAKNGRFFLNIHARHDEKMDSLFWAYAILVQWYHARAILDKTAKSTPKESLKREREEVVEHHTPRLSFNDNEFRRHFIKDEWALQEEERQPTRSFDGPSPINVTLDSLLVKHMPGFGTGISTPEASRIAACKLLASNPSTEQLTAVVQELKSLIERMKRYERPILYKSSIRLSPLHRSMVEMVVNTLSHSLLYKSNIRLSALHQSMV